MATVVQPSGMKLWDFVTRNRRAWINALMHSDYEQGQGYLNSEGKLCCLGVACEVVINNYGIGIDKKLNTEYNDPTYQYDGNIATLDENQLRIFGLSDADQQMLVALNDNGAPFKAIAQALEYLPFHHPDGQSIAFDSDSTVDPVEWHFPENF